MSYELYWYGDTWLVEDYRKADRLRQERTDEIAWLQGLYHGMAISGTIGNAFREKGEQPCKYPKKPLGLSKPSNQSEEADDTAFAKLYMNNMVRAGKNWGKRR